MSIIKTVVIRPTEEPFFSVELLQDDLHTFYDIIHCTTVDMPTRRYGVYTLAFILDDEGALVEHPSPSVMSPYGELFFGNVIIVLAVPPDIESLPDIVIEYLRSSVHSVLFPDGTYRTLVDLR